MSDEQPQLIRSSADTPDERRRHPRFTPKGVQSLLGEVLDLSASGMRVFHKGRAVVEVGDEFDILLQHRDHDVLVPVRVVWVERVGVRRQAVGLEVTDQSPAVQQRILAMHPQHDQPEAPGPKAFMMR